MGELIRTTTRQNSLINPILVVTGIGAPILIMMLVDLFVAVPSWAATPTLVVGAVLAVGLTVGQHLRWTAMRDQLRKTGQWSTATVKTAKQQSSPTRGEFRVYLVLEVQDDVGTFTVEHTELVDAIHLARLQEGSEFGVVYDRADKSRLILRLD